MGFTDLLSEAGLTILNNWVKTRSYIVGYSPSQADVKTFQALKSAPAVEKFPYAYRWYKHIGTFESEFSALPGDPSKEYTAYGPEVSELPTNPKAANKEVEEEDDDDVDLFGSDDEEEDAEAARIRDERLAEYTKRRLSRPSQLRSLLSLWMSSHGMMRLT